MPCLLFVQTNDIQENTANFVSHQLHLSLVLISNITYVKGKFFFAARPSKVHTHGVQNHACFWNQYSYNPNSLRHLTSHAMFSIFPSNLHTSKELRVDRTPLSRCAAQGTAACYSGPRRARPIMDGCCAGPPASWVARSSRAGST